MNEHRTGEAGSWEYLGIQALRAVAALAVVLGHSLNFLQRDNGAVPTMIAGFQGAVGVDLFFVISGFVMTISADRLINKPHPARLFLWRRVLRVAPLYWLLLAVKLLLLVAVPSLDAVHPVTAWNVAASFLFLPSANKIGEIRPLIAVGWTLNFEMAFYLVFACALLIRRRFVWMLTAAICLLGVVGFFRPPGWPVWTSLADPIVLEFLAGVGIAWLTRAGKLPGYVMSGACLALGATGLWCIKPGLALALRAGFWGVPAALVVVGVVGLERAWRRLIPGWLLLLGSASYAIYLTQVFVFPVVDWAAQATLLHGVTVSSREVGEAVVLWSLLLATLTGVLTHLWVEVPITKLLKRRFGTERIAPVARVG